MGCIFLLPYSTPISRNTYHTLSSKGVWPAGANTGNLLTLPPVSVICSKRFLFNFLRRATSALNFLKYFKRSLMSLDIAESFESIFTSILRNNCTNSWLLSFLSAASVCVRTISTTYYSTTKNKNIALLTRQLAEKTIACNFFLCTCAICLFLMRIITTLLHLMATELVEVVIDTTYLIYNVTLHDHMITCNFLSESNSCCVTTMPRLMFFRKVWQT